MAPGLGLPSAYVTQEPRIPYPRCYQSPAHARSVHLVSCVVPHMHSPAHPSLPGSPDNFCRSPAASCNKLSVLWVGKEGLNQGLSCPPHPTRALGLPKVRRATLQGKPRITGEPGPRGSSLSPLPPSCPLLNACAHRNPCLGPGTVRRSTNKSCFLTGSHLYFSFVPLS